MRPPVSYLDLGGSTAKKIVPAFAKGCGGDICDDGNIREGDVFFWGSPKIWHILTQAQDEGRTWYYGDHAYFGKGYYYRITRNRYQHPGIGYASDERLKELAVPEVVCRRATGKMRALDIQVKPWRKTGSHIVICPPAPEFSSLMGFDNEAWLMDVFIGLREYTDRPIRIRRKSKVNAARPLEMDLVNAWALVSYNSMTLVQAILAGIPAIALAPWCAAATMGGSALSQINNPPTPEGRYQWAANLAANQWTLQEIARGDAWRALQ